MSPLKLTFRDLWRVIGVGQNEIVQTPTPVVELHRALRHRWLYRRQLFNGPTSPNIDYITQTIEKDCFAEIWGSINLRTAISATRGFSLVMRETMDAMPFLDWPQYPPLAAGSMVHWHIDHIFLNAGTTITLFQGDPLATGEGVLAVLVVRLFLQE